MSSDWVLVTCGYLAAVAVWVGFVLLVRRGPRPGGSRPPEDSG